ncbi:hypothetical protein DH2020_015814 [Rehmannia glutinosa]|uniref:Glucose-6-phosphate 1-epimerase n=1 Tax=Rehmannia glutinosa TaxID=99300 RepID=A0ABR0WX01_REHGL
MAIPTTWSFSPTTSVARPRRVSRFSGVAMASASANVENVKVTKGLGDLPKVILTSVHGRCCIYRAEAHQHGFARNMNWSIVSSENVEGNPTITLELKDGPYSRAMWDYGFQALYKVTLGRNTLSTELKVTNTDEKPFSFTTALHTYFSALVTGASVRGLKGCKTLNKHPDPKNPVEGKEERDIVTFPGFVDCVYLETPGELQLDNGLGDVITIKNTNWSDAVLWNPHLMMEACYKDFVCVENAKIGQVQLEPSESWTAVQHLSVA